MTEPAAADFVVTKEHRRFVELCDNVRRHRYIGLCHGPPGIGKTLSARRYAHWDQLDGYIQRFTLVQGGTVPAELLDARTIMYTPVVHNTPNCVDKAMRHLQSHANWAIEQGLRPDEEEPLLKHPDLIWNEKVELVIVDEADRLKTASLEQLRDHHDRTGVGLVLIGMPGLERRLARYPQLYSRIGFAHQYRPLSADELTFVLTHHWQRLGLTVSPDDFTDTEALAAAARITTGNFRLIHRLFAQIARLLEINHLTTITAEIVEAARESLVIGQT